MQERSEHAPQANEHTLMLFVRYSKTFKWFLTSTVQLDQCEVGSIFQVQRCGDQSTKCTHARSTHNINCNKMLHNLNYFKHNFDSLKLVKYVIHDLILIETLHGIFVLHV